nr:NLR family CARD domain-containing protein 3-like [Misgurnus anguillicaudatus]
MASVLELLYETLDDLEEDKLKRFKSILRHDGSISASKLEKADATDTVDMLECFGSEEEAVKITINILRKMNQNQLAEQLEMKHLVSLSVCYRTHFPNYISLILSFSFMIIYSCPFTVIQKDCLKPVVKQTEDFPLKEFLKRHRTNMKEKVEHIFEGKKEHEALLNDVYTDLFITEGDVERVNEAHEIHKIEKAFNSSKSEERSISCTEIFHLLREKNKKKIILTKGIAGIGKTVSTHKFILDWAEGKSNQDISCMFLLPFREINFVKDKKLNFHEFLLEFYPELKEVDKAKLYKSCNLAFIFDGLDESRLPLNFQSGILSSIEEKSSVDELFTNLVRGNLLPSALVWVTSRPAAANQIPPEFVGLYTEVRGFNEELMSLYFSKRFKDEAQASKVLMRIRMSRSICIMCYIPVFCWITATVIQENLISNDTDDANSEMMTLTEMYIHFLLIQMNMKNRKYDQNSERVRTKLLESNKAMILKLAKLAFEQLKKNNAMFYEEELRECGIDENEDYEGTGMLTEIFKKEAGLHEMKVFCFVHLSVQEFLAALHVFLCYLNKNVKEICFFFKEERASLRFFFKMIRAAVKNITLHDFLTEVVNKTMESKTGHYDLFLRFLLGISLESNQKLLKGLLTHTEDSTESVVKITDYIKKQRELIIKKTKIIFWSHSALDLEEDKLKRFKSILRQDGPIPASKLEKADVTDTVDKMLECFGSEGAVKITINILRKINQNQLAEQLEMKHSEGNERAHGARDTTEAQWLKHVENFLYLVRPEVQQCSHHRWVAPEFGNSRSETTCLERYRSGRLVRTRVRLLCSH